MTDDRVPKSDRSLIALLRQLPGLLIALAKAELAQAKAELSVKLKHAGIGMGLLVGAALFGFFAFGVLVAAAVLGIAVALPPWLAALIVGVALLVVAGILAAVGARSLKKGMPPVPTETLQGLKEDIQAIKGMGTYDH